MKKIVMSFICVLTVIAGLFVGMNQSWGVDILGELKITGVQISTAHGGFRVLYSVSERIDDRRVTERGLIYGLADRTNESELDIAHQNNIVKVYAATADGLQSSENGVGNYVMTMSFGGYNSVAFMQEYIVRPYAKLRNGTYYYGDAETFRVFDVADELYKNCKMKNESDHDYLYNTILKTVQSDYGVVAYQPPTTQPTTTESETADENKTIENGDLMKIAFAIVSSAENSSLNFREQYSYIENIGDGRGYTGGIIGFTSGTGDMLEVVQQYISLKPQNNPLVPYLSALQAVNGTDSEAGLGSNFVRAWKTAAADQEMIEAQNKIVREWYLHPAVQDAQTDGLSILGQFIYYDAMVMHGPGNDSESFGGIRKAALRAAVSPANGGDEATYLKAFIEARKRIMLLEEAHEDLSRLNAQLKFINEGNFEMKLPLTWTMYGDSFTLTQNILDRL